MEFWLGKDEEGKVFCQLKKKNGRWGGSSVDTEALFSENKTEQKHKEVKEKDSEKGGNTEGAL